MMRAAGKGDLYIHQDANWNVIATTDLGGNLSEHYVYEPYGSLTVNQSSSWGDRDGDGDVDATDKGTVGVTCTGTVSAECRILDLDFDGDYDNDDATAFDNNLVQGAAKKAGRTHSGVGQAMGHQGLVADNASANYYARKRQYSFSTMRLVQTDPLAYEDGLNLYAYCGSNLPNMIDPYGELSGPGRFKSILSIANYGFFCGPESTGVFGQCAKDCMDSGCCNHDACYASAVNGLDFNAVVAHLTGIKIDKELAACDRDLCRTAYCCPVGHFRGSVYRAGLLAVFSCNRRYLTGGTNCQSVPRQVGGFCARCGPQV